MNSSRYGLHSYVMKYMFQCLGVLPEEDLLCQGTRCNVGADAYCSILDEAHLSANRTWIHCVICFVFQ